MGPARFSLALSCPFRRNKVLKCLLFHALPGLYLSTPQKLEVFVVECEGCRTSTNCMSNKQSKLLLCNVCICTAAGCVAEHRPWERVHTASHTQRIVSQGAGEATWRRGARRRPRSGAGAQVRTCRCLVCGLCWRTQHSMDVVVLCLLCVCLTAGPGWTHSGRCLYKLAVGAGGGRS